MKDSCDIYVLLEHREEGKTKRLATAWFRGGDIQTGWKTLEMPLVYGELPAGTAAYMLLKTGETWGDITKEVPVRSQSSSILGIQFGYELILWSSLIFRAPYRILEIPDLYTQHSRNSANSLILF
ncbi:hypothetical protein [Chitinophaga defluvii]|uniref:Uncharacterized protein n=1 Tax=Chitinophaga defluvii TaxID=3163343 RepID=A0ABV2TEV0_9BACT